MWKLALVLAALACLFLILPSLSKRARDKRQHLLLLAVLFAFAAMLLGRSVTSRVMKSVSLADFRPIEVAGHLHDPYVSSENCQDCHQEQFESWHASYHRTMTQVASPQTVIGDFSNVKTKVYGREIILSQKGNEYWVRMHDPETPVTSNSTLIDRPVVMTTGSHHMQVYWYATGKDRRLGQLPVVWLKETKSWAPIHSIFLRPTQTKLGSAEGRWNSTCIKCHTTQGRPRIDETQTPPVDTHVAEFGIACEACHGPGGSHARHHQKTGIASDPQGQDERHQMVDPQAIDHRRSAEICGQCHGVWIAGSELELDKAMYSGLSFRPGDKLSDTRHIFSTGQSRTEHVQKHLQADPDFMGDRFWSDGMVRVSGREYNGLVRSSCYQRGVMTCVSCHALHPDASVDKHAWADDQLGKRMESNLACIQCHESYADRQLLVAHTHHAAESSGSLCYNCHMPHTTYGLLKAIRSHEISSPSAQETAEIGRPNACNQCHIDRSLSWTASHLEDWYSIEAPHLTADQQEHSATLLAAIRGDAGQRALAAWSLGWQEALASSRSDWVAPILAQLLNDPYHAVRYVAHRSLKQQPDYRGFKYDFLGSDSYRAEKTGKVIEQWRGNRFDRPADESLLIGSNGDLLFEELQAMLRQRNNRTVVLAE